MAGSASDPWYEGSGARDTTITDLDLTSCLTRLQILAALGRAPLDVSHVAAAAEISVNLASGHLARLAKAGLVEFERQGGHHVYRLSAGTHVESTGAGTRVTARASDGCESSVFVPSTSPVSRALCPPPEVMVKAAPAPAPSPGARTGSRRPTGRG